MIETTDDPGLFASKPTPEAITEQFRGALKELWMTPGDLANHMAKHGDHRDISATVRGIQRALSGETRVSGELLAIVGMLLRQRRRLKLKYADLQWHQMPNGVWYSKVDDWYVHIAPQTRGRWVLWCRHGTRAEDYSPPFGRWLNSLEEAKEKALVCVEEGVNDKATHALGLPWWAPPMVSPTQG